MRGIERQEELIAAIFGRRPVEPTPLSRRGLRTIAAIRASVARLETQLVERARLDGATWAEIADDLRLSRRAVRARHPDPRRLAAPVDGE